MERSDIRDRILELQRYPRISLALNPGYAD
jgi:hypothetical protein